MNLDAPQWKEFVVKKLFKKPRIKKYSAIPETAGKTPFVSSSSENNGVSQLCDEIPNISRCITVSTNGNCFDCFYHDEPICVSNDVEVLVNDRLSEYQMLFLCSVLKQESYKYNYGRKAKNGKVWSTVLKLPIQHNSGGEPVIDNAFKYSEQGYVPDWDFMENYVKSLHHKPLTTKRAHNRKLLLDVSDWEDFDVSDIFNLKYGINMELNACEECGMHDKDAVAFVARTAENNGVSAYVKRKPNKVPQKAGTITCAAGGSVLSTFVQFHDFYSGRDLYLLKEKERLSTKAKLFLTTIILKNQYKYSFGRQANKTLPSLMLKLPIQRNSDGTPVVDKEKKYNSKGWIPDWKFMEDYINSLPYSDRLPV